MRKIVGISQKIKRAWLDVVLDRLDQALNEKEVRAFLDGHLRNELPGTESRAKASGIVLRIWSGVGPQHVALGIERWRSCPEYQGRSGFGFTGVWLRWRIPSSVILPKLSVVCSLSRTISLLSRYKLEC